MAIVRVNQNSGTLAAGTSNAVTFGWTTTAGNTLVVFISERTLSDTLNWSATGCTVTDVYLTPASAGQSQQRLGYALNMSNAITQITITSGLSRVKAWTVIEYSGVANTGQDDGNGSDAPAASTTSKGHQLVTVNANDVVLQSISNSANAGATIASAGPVASAGSTDPTWQSVSNISNSGGTNGSIGIAVADAIVSSAATYQAQWTTNSAAWTGGGLALKASAAATTSTSSSSSTKSTSSSSSSVSTSSSSSSSVSTSSSSSSRSTSSSSSSSSSSVSTSSSSSSSSSVSTSSSSTLAGPVPITWNNFLFVTGGGSISTGERIRGVTIGYPK